MAVVVVVIVVAAGTDISAGSREGVAFDLDRSTAWCRLRLDLGL